jgi:hypothetical protein
MANKLLILKDGMVVGYDEPHNIKRLLGGGYKIAIKTQPGEQAQILKDNLRQLRNGGNPHFQDTMILNIDDLDNIDNRRERLEVFVPS